VQFVEYILAGLGVGIVFGIFGAGGSAFATPILALLGVPPLLAVASPLPAMIPAAFNGARRYLREGNLDGRVARLAVIGGFPGTIVGAFTSQFVGGANLLVLSGLMLAVVGARMLLPDRTGATHRGVARAEQTPLVLGATFAVGFLTGLLANGGGFLLVPLFVLVLGMTATRAAGTSMVVVGILTIPTLITHTVLGHVSLVVASGFAIGLIPASAYGAHISQRLHPARARAAFGAMLVVFSIWFLIHEIT
jgi:uncharacterized membrane protein YfcA